MSNIDEISLLTDGFSGREIEKIMIAVQAVVYGSTSLILNGKVLMEEIQFKVNEHKSRLKIVNDKISYS